MRGSVEIGGIGVGEFGRAVVAKIEPGSDLLSSLREVAMRHGIRCGVILSAVGSLSRVTIRNLKEFPTEFPITDGNREFYTAEGKPFEILSLSGSIVPREDGEIAVHAHLAVSTVSGGRPVVLGGHLVEGNATYVMTEVAIAEVKGINVSRRLHPERRSWELSFD